MSQYEKESLSALLDNEADELELRRLLKSSETNPEITQAWERYHLAQSVLHGKGIRVSADLSERIRQEIQTEPAHAPAPALSSWQQSFGRVAIAASVALVVVVAVQTNITEPSTPTVVQQDVQSTPVQSAVTPPVTLVADNAASELDREAVQQILIEYLEHVEIDEKEPVINEQIQDSPLYRLVNELQAKP